MAISTFPPRFTKAMLVRSAVDAVLVEVGLVTAYVVRLLAVALTTDNHALAAVRVTYQESFLCSFAFLGVLAIAAFWLAGFYTNGAMYRGRFRLPWIGAVAALLYAVYGFFVFMSANWFLVPRGVIPLGAVVTATLLIAARLASQMWARVLFSEGRITPPKRLEDIEVQHVLVVGGGGYIGSALLPRLLARGYKVRLLDLMLFGTDPIRDLVAHPNLEIVEADFRQVDKVVQAMRGIHAVIHLGGIVGDPACSVDEELTIDVNLTATRVIAEIARGVGVQRFVFASTCSVYGASREALDETSDLNPISLYARTKLVSEQVLQDMASDDFAPVILRFGTIYGISGRTRFDLVVNLLTAKAVQEKRITIFGGKQWRPFVHVDDAAKAVFLAFEAPLRTVRNEVFNVGTDDQNYTIEQVGSLVAGHIPDAELVNMGSDTDVRDYRVRFARIRDVLGFRASWTVEQGIDQVQAALKAGRVKDYREPHYSNVKSLTEDHNSRFLRPQTNWAHDLLDESKTPSNADRDTAAATRPLHTDVGPIPRRA